jgi:hypothetical protein
MTIGHGILCILAEVGDELAYCLKLVYIFSRYGDGWIEEDDIGVCSLLQV